MEESNYNYKLKTYMKNSAIGNSIKQLPTDMSNNSNINNKNQNDNEKEN